MPTHPLLERLRQLAQRGPIVVAHRGDSRNHPENTLAAFHAAMLAGVRMQEFDVRQTRDGVLVCLHDDGLDRTTDASVRLGPGAAVAQVDLEVLQQLDAGRWRGPEHAGARVPTLREALAAMLPACVPMVERKAGTPDACITDLAAAGAADAAILQAFDWAFLAAVHEQAPQMALAALGPTTAFPSLSDEAIAAAAACGAGMLHWQASALRCGDVQRVHRAGLLLCTYTTDDPIGWAGHAALGIDAFCTNDPAGALAALGAHQAAGPSDQ
jgi:glycerophosphoryl diester phosphodiesterase